MLKYLLVYYNNQFNMFSVYVSILSLVASAVALNNPSARIHGGKDAVIEDYPYQVSIRYLGHHICGGAIISDQHVVTAAHCVYGVYPKSTLTILVGTNDVTDEINGKLYNNISGIDIMTNFDPRTLKDDVAILKIETQIKFDDTVKAIEFYDEKDFPSPTEGVNLTVTGWGNKGSNSWGSKTLQVITKTVKNHTECSTLYEKNGEQILPQMFCVEKGACHGDDGAPAVDESGRLVGLFSWSFGCMDDFPGVYINLGAFRTLIKNRYGI